MTRGSWLALLEEFERMMIKSDMLVILYVELTQPVSRNRQRTLRLCGDDAAVLRAEVFWYEYAIIGCLVVLGLKKFP